MPYTLDDLIRIRTLLDVDQKQFGKLLGLSREMVNKMEKGQKPISDFTDQKLRQIEENIDEIRSQVHTEGELIKSPRGKKTQPSGNGLIPYYDVDFAAGGMELYTDTSIVPAYYMDIPEFKGCTAFRAYSDSMEELIKSGNILFGRKVIDWRVYLEYGQIYGITTKDNRRHLKYIRKAKDHEHYFLLKSENPNYDDFEIPKGKIKNVWLIEGWLNRRT